MSRLNHCYPFTMHVCVYTERKKNFKTLLHFMPKNLNIKL